MRDNDWPTLTDPLCIIRYICQRIMMRTASLPHSSRVPSFERVRGFRVIGVIMKNSRARKREEKKNVRFDRASR